jgi:hypothetical protein
MDRNAPTEPSQELAAARFERDEYRQELFETNRYSAWLARERHELMAQLDACRQSINYQSPLTLAELQNYIAFLEGYTWEQASLRLRLDRRIAELEAALSDSRASSAKAGQDGRNS